MVYTGQIQSDFLKLAKVEDVDKERLINYAATDFISLRESLVEYIKAVYPLDYNYFSESDLGMMLVELVAYMGHVLSYKSDLLANENYLKTARQRDSVRKLLELIGVRIKGPIAAAANARITLDSNPWTTEDDSQSLTFFPQNRVITINSPQDGLPITYTLYKVAPDGDIDVANSTGNITVYNSEKASDTVLENLILLEGSLVIDSGTFSNVEQIKSITLERAPVIEGSVQVFITGDSNTSGVYRQVDSFFYASGANDKIFQVIPSENYQAKIIFGDSNLGKNPNLGDSYTVVYRIGGGTRGNIRSEVIDARSSVVFDPGGGNPTSIIDVTVENSGQATGGSDAETLEHAKRYAPLMFRSQNRLVTLQDYKAFANSYITSYGSVGKANAIVRRAYSSANIIDVYVLEKANNIQLRRATQEFKHQLVEAMNELKMMTDEVIVVDGLIRTLDLVITARLDRKYATREDVIKTKIRSKILQYFNVDNNDFGKQFDPQDLVNYIFSIPEVRFATVDNVAEVIKLNFNEIVQLNNFTVNIVYV